jgi:lipopolysaccharide export system permease protein
MMGFILVFLLVELTDKIKYYIQYSPPAWLMCKYFLVKIPGYLFFAVPLSILLGGMLSLSVMARNHEIVAMQAGGIDGPSIARPMLLVGAISSVLLFVADETVIPWSNRRSEQIQEVEIAGRPDRTFFRRDQVWMRTPRAITHIRKVAPSRTVLEGVTIVEWDSSYNLMRRLNADKAVWSAGEWVLYGVNRMERQDGGRFVVDAVPSMTGLRDKTPEDFGRIERLTKEMTLSQLGEYIQAVIDEGQKPVRYLVDWHAKIAFPVVCLIMAALSVPFAVRMNPRSGGAGLGLAVGLVVAFAYWIVQTMFIALGHGGYIPPVLAAWGADAVFGLTAFLLILETAI